MRFDNQNVNVSNSLQNTIFSSLQISKEIILNEMAILLAKQQFSQYAMEVDYFEKKYGQSFESFDEYFQTQSVSYDMENDWLKWKFAWNSKNYWHQLLLRMQL